MMKVHSTNYHNTFIEVAEDCPDDQGTIPPMRGNKKSFANLQYELLIEKPYTYTSDEIFFKIHTIRKDLTPAEWPAAKAAFFSKGQPCFRASPLTKRYGWGIHSDENGKVALIGRETSAYEKFVKQKDINKVKAMRSKRK